MAGRTKPGQYSPVSLEALTLIAKRERKDPRLLLAYLALARHTTMKDLDGRGPNMITGAGAKKVMAVAYCGAPMANSMIRVLCDMGLIKKAPASLPPMQARWAMQHRGTVNIPHALIDGISHGDGIDRLLKSGASNEVITCAIMLLVYCYAGHDLQEHGGISQQALWREWRHQISTQEQGFRVTAEPASEYSKKAWQQLVMASMGLGDGEQERQTFWDAFNMLKDAGLIYEVLTAIKGNQRFPIRVNDLHATQNDPSLMGSIREVGFYEHKDNERSAPESCRVYLHVEPEKLVGIWRLRFRCSTPETAAGIDQDYEAIEIARAGLVKADILYE